MSGGRFLDGSFFLVLGPVDDPAACGLLLLLWRGLLLLLLGLRALLLLRRAGFLLGSLLWLLLGGRALLRGALRRRSGGLLTLRILLRGGRARLRWPALLPGPLLLRSLLSVLRRLLRRPGFILVGVHS